MHGRVEDTVFHLESFKETETLLSSSDLVTPAPACPPQGHISHHGFLELVADGRREKDSIAVESHVRE